MKNESSVSKGIISKFLEIPLEKKIINPPVSEGIISKFASKKVLEEEQSTSEDIISKFTPVKGLKEKYSSYEGYLALFEEMRKKRTPILGKKMKFYLGMSVQEAENLYDSLCDLHYETDPANYGDIFLINDKKLILYSVIGVGSGDLYCCDNSNKCNHYAASIIKKVVNIEGKTVYNRTDFGFYSKKSIEESK
jgi:hypothetical protein